ncbi:MAG: hypothetical protein M1833_005447 [Piccolia ochrophora]|nr:MAG: hypothetical protein M1833_005447 [Piccolia ochrophora]
MEVQIPNFLSFAPSLIDQNLWERVGDVDIVGDVGLGAPHGEVADVNLLALVREFIGHVSMPTLMGQSFLENFPNTLQDLWMFDRGIKYLALGFPRWLPARAATQAHLARARLLYSIRSFHRALNQANAETPSKMEWGDMDDVSELMERRAAIWREGTVTPDAAAAADLSLLWAMTVNANTLCFWLILRILSTPGLLDQVREESSAYVTVSPPESIRGVTELARLKLADEGLVHDCPLFRACYLETLRLHSGPWSVRKVARDWELGRGPAGDDGPPQSFVLSAGSFVEIPHGVHHADPRYFDRPETFDPARFLVPRGTGDGKSRVEIGSFRPYGGGASTCKGRVFAERACLAYVAGLLALWEFRPVQRGGWVLPSARPATAVSIPTRDVRVRVSRRV